MSGALTELWGFDTDEFRLPSEDEILSAKEKCGDDKLIFDDGKKVYIPDGAKLNLGSAGKGIALDEAVKRIDEINSQGGKITGAVISVDIRLTEKRQKLECRNTRPVQNGKRLFCGAVAYRCFYINLGRL